jgi:hypothetical protein
LGVFGGIGRFLGGIIGYRGGIGGFIGGIGVLGYIGRYRGVMRVL